LVKSQNPTDRARYSHFKKKYPRQVLGVILRLKTLLIGQGILT